MSKVTDTADTATLTTSPTSFIYLSQGRILLVGNALDNGSHSHNALQLTVSLENRPLVVKHPQGEVETDCALISPNHEHQVDLRDTWRALILINAESERAQQIRERYLQLSPVATPTAADNAFCRQQLQPFANQPQTIDAAAEAIDAIVGHFAGPAPEPRPLDLRVSKVMELIHRPYDQEYAVDALAKHISLSASRLSHLFRDEVGIPLKHYLLWQKLHRAGFNIGAGKPMSQAATEAGFADAAHFSRTFRAMFGMPPSNIMRASASVMVISDTLQKDSGKLPGALI